MSNISETNPFITPTIRRIGPDEPVTVVFPNKETLEYVIKSMSQGVQGLDGQNDWQHQYMSAILAMYTGLGLTYPHWYKGWPLPKGK